MWPHIVRKGTSNRNDVDHGLDPPRKSVSMGAIKSSQSNTLAGIHKKRTTIEKEGAT